MVRPKGARKTIECELAIVLSDIGLGGTQRAAVRLIAEWVQAGRRVAVITLSDVTSDFFSLSPKVVRISLNLQRSANSRGAGLLNNVQRLFRLRRAIRQAGARRVLSFLPATNVLSLIATRGLGLQVVVCERNDIARQRIEAHWALMRRLTYRWADVVTFNSSASLAAADFVRPSRKRYLPNMLALNPGAAVNPRRKIFLFVGRLTYQKGCDVLLRAWAKACRNLPEWRLEFVGDGPEREPLRELSRALDLEGTVSWFGAVEDPTDYYTTSAVFVMASRYEGTSNAMLEAMANGLPCIVTDLVVGNQEVTRPEATVLAVPANSPDVLAETMTRLARDAELRRRIGDSARQSLAGLSPEPILKLWDIALDLPPP